MRYRVLVTGVWELDEADYDGAPRGPVTHEAWCRLMGIDAPGMHVADLQHVQLAWLDPPEPERHEGTFVWGGGGDAGL